MTDQSRTTQKRHNGRDRDQFEQGLRLRPAVIYEIVREEGEEELSRTFSALWWSGLAAGLSVSFSMVVMGIIISVLPNESWAKPLAAAGYSTGFVIVILTRQQLFTENTITALLPVMARHSGANASQMLRLWAIVLAANLVGATLFSIAVTTTPLFAPEHREAFYQIGKHLFENSPMEMFLKGILAGWLIAALVWVLPSAQNYKFWVIFFFTWIIGLGEFTHIVAGTTEAMVLLIEGGTSLTTVIFGFGFPTLTGNIVGGSALFALISYAQVKDEVAEVAEENGTVDRLEDTDT